MKVVISKAKDSRPVVALFNKETGSIYFRNKDDNLNTILLARGAKCEEGKRDWEDLITLKGLELIYKGDSITITF